MRNANKSYIIASLVGWVSRGALSDAFLVRMLPSTECIEGNLAPIGKVDGILATDMSWYMSERTSRECSPARATKCH